MVLAVLIGSLIGYVTNWLAIRMLFRPLTEKKILSWRIPLTPGVIPKEKERLAGSIGDTVGNLLLNEEQVVARLLAPAVEEQVRNFIRRAGEQSLEDRRTIRQILTRLGAPEEEMEQLIKNAARYLAGLLQDSAYRRRLAAALAGAADSLLDRRVRDLVFSRGYGEFKEGLEQALEQLLAGEPARQAARRAVERRLLLAAGNEQPLSELLPPELLEQLVGLVEARGPDIAAALQNYIQSPATRTRLKAKISRFFEENLFKRVVGNVFNLIGADSRTLARRAAEEIVEFLAGPHNQAEISRQVGAMFRDYLNQSPARLLPAGLKAREEILGHLAGCLTEVLTSPGNAARLLNDLDLALAGQESKTWRQLLNIPAADQGASLSEDLIYRLLGAAPGPRLEQTLHRLLQALAARCLDLPVKDLAEFWGKFGPPALEEDLVRHYQNFVRTRVPGLIGFVNVNGMVRHRVNELDVLQVEDMMLGIMRKELVAITWLGALLGAVIGLAMAGLQYFL
jgi:uncharacterized membrane protein YheB (UPF0754 family)